MPTMKAIRFLSAAILILLAGGNISAQGVVKDPTKWSYEVKKTGDNKYRLIFHCILTKPEFHIYGLNPGKDPTPIPATFSFQSSAAYKTVGKMQETGKLISEDLSDIGMGIIYYYKGKVDFSQDVVVTGNTTITGTHNYQVCNDQMCLPQKEPLPFSFKIADAKGVAADSANKDTTIIVAAPPVQPGSTLPTSDSTDQKLRPDDRKSTKKLLSEMQMSPIILFFTGLGNGLVSVITPCVFAMLPMTVSFFLKRSKDRRSGIKIALQYSLNIVLIFTVIGGVLSLLFGADALHAFSTNWIVNLVFFVIFLVFGISFLGAFEINLPSSWATKLDSKANTQSFLGIFFMALTLVVVSFSCTGAFIGNLLGAMSQGGKLGPLTGFFGYGVGLALPFALFAIFPGMLNELGKSGGWLNAVKVTFGFIELALAMKFLSNVDLDRGWRLLDREIFVAIWAVLSFALGLYLLGVIRFSHDSDLPKNDWGLPYLKVPRLLLAISALVFTIYLLPGMWGAPLKAMGAFVPPMGTHDFIVLNGNNAGVVNTANVAAGGHSESRKYASRMKMYEPDAVLKGGFDVYYDYDEALAVSKKLGKPVMLDFTGIQCVNCRKFESEVWSNSEVMKRMKNDFIIASLFTDARNVPIEGEAKRHSEVIGKDITSLGDKNVDIQISQFNTNRQPVYYFVDASGRKLADNGVGYPTAPSDFVTHLDAVKARYKQLHP